MDVPWTLIHRHAFGDTSGLWEIAKLPALFMMLLMLAICALLIWYVTQ